jgi:hypothetical protein
VGRRQKVQGGVRGGKGALRGQEGALRELGRAEGKRSREGPEEAKGRSEDRGGDRGRGILTWYVHRFGGRESAAEGGGRAGRPRVVRVVGHEAKSGMGDQHFVHDLFDVRFFRSFGLFESCKMWVKNFGDGTVLDKFFVRKKFVFPRKKNSEAYVPRLRRGGADLRQSIESLLSSNSLSAD